ncbi:unnamed protein product, partial [marine sediment metagenome]
ENWVKLPVGKTVCMRFREYRVASREITDPFWKTPRTVESLLFLVSHVDGVPVDKSFSVVSEKLALEFKPYLDDGSYRGYEWCLVKDGEGFTAPRIASRRRV